MTDSPILLCAFGFALFVGAFALLYTVRLYSAREIVDAALQDVRWNDFNAMTPEPPLDAGRFLRRDVMQEFRDEETRKASATAYWQERHHEALDEDEAARAQ